MTLSLLVAAAKTVAALHAQGAIQVDGVLDDATWLAAPWIDDFVQKEPTEGATPTERTEVAIAFDGDALYVAARMELLDPSTLDRPMTRRDDTSGAERFIISLDPYRSRRTAYSFAVTAAGVRADWIHTDDDERARDMSWNPVWRAAISIGDHEWTVEMRIPLSQLRFPAVATPVWGVDFNRYVPRTGEDDFWIAVPKDVTGWASYFGELRGLDGATQGVRLELLPYVSSSLSMRSRSLVAPGDPRMEPTESAGVDVKVGLGHDLTLDATVNPDFGQVEADPAVVNLEAYEVTFDERRPFFVEGSQIFSSNPRTYFYSRRIGAGARILGAVKLTGHASSNTNLGALTAVTLSSARAPATSWNVMRVERELAGGGVAGMLLTGVGRGAGLEEALPRGAITGGADVRLRPGSGRYEIFAAAGGSAITGDAAAISAIQRSPAHYFQRPDAGHVALDPAATSMAGWHADLAASRRAGRWRYEAALTAESPGLELNDAGILQSADDLDLYVSGSHVVTTPGRYLHGWSLTVADVESFNFDGVYKPAENELVWNATLPGFIGLELGASLERPGQSDDATRGGPLKGVGWTGETHAAISSSRGGAIDYGASVAVIGLGHELVATEMSGQLLWRAMDRLRFELAPSLRAGTAYAQYVDAVEGTAGGADTFGTRYVFATLELREAGVQLRGQLSLSPDLTIDAYAEPFASSGRFVAFGELPRPRARELRRYGRTARADGTVTVDDGGDRFTFDDPDFTFLSLRSTLVLRWEFHPGSTLYAVWQQNRASGEGVARGLSGGVAGDVFSAPGENVVAVKLSYWWSP